ncbi:hypothetical protein C1645_805507 [Glomus cerebriforme]|uniref:Rad9-domain-containing protein n=1 Tax=Glomus cerebriforme TaxID=658196 RepID=A0A397SY41_9GLOM|nr:hypothetical protein C1645_805507 [Glomus cerebriforme]
MPIQTFSAKVVEFKLAIFYKLMQELSRGNDELTFIVYRDKLVIKPTSTSTLNILVTLSLKLFDSFQMERPKMYTIFSSSIRDIFSRTTMDLSSLRIIIEESNSLSEENLMIFEIYRKMRSIQSRYNVYCTKISDGISEFVPLNEDLLSEENHWSIDSKNLKKNHWPNYYKNDNVRFFFGLDSLGVSNIISNDSFLSESRYVIQKKEFVNYDVTNPIDIRINRKSFEKMMQLAYSLKCNLNAHFSDKDSDDKYQPQPFYLCGEVERYIKFEGKIFGSHIEYGNRPERPLHREIVSALNAPNQINPNTNDNNEIEYPVAEGFRQPANAGFSSSYSSVPTADENYMPVAGYSTTTLVNGNVNTRNPYMRNPMGYTYDNNHFNVNRINSGNREFSTVSNMSSFQDDNKNNNTVSYYEPSSYGTGSDLSLIPDEEISKRLETVKFDDNRVSGMKRSFSETGSEIMEGTSKRYLSGDNKNNDEPKIIRSLKFLSQD